ncbi:MAG: leader peptidase (prepilin peptidase) / N-methyltransferase [Actinomycetota bacterium]|nr:leader peptidase (prepilin peptidase) / N-methyltransferase [Actinomycetota bacterium]
MTGFIVAVCAVLGLAVGSFLNVVIYRVPRKESVVSPRSRCPRCGTEITAFDNIPVLSWLLLRGRCRTCREPISVRYPLIEVGCAALFAAMALRFGADWALPAFLTLAAALLAGSAIDIEHQLLPDRLVFPSLALALPMLVVAAAVDDRWGSLARGLIGAVIASGGLLGMALAWPRAGAMGGGDIKLALLLGLCLGWLGLGHVALGLFLGFLFGSIVGVALVVTKAKALQEHFAFGPFLAAGTLVAVWWGTPLLDLYLHR